MDDYLQQSCVFYENNKSLSTGSNKLVGRDLCCFKREDTIILSEKIPLDNSDFKLHLSKLSESVRACAEIGKQRNSKIGGVIQADNTEHIPFGDVEFSEIMRIYAEQAFALVSGGADVIIITDILSLSHCRAAILGAKQTQAPVIVFVNPNSSFELENRGSVQTSLICAQSLGADGFGLYTPDWNEYIEDIGDMYSYASIPMFIWDNFSQYGDSNEDIIKLSKFAIPFMDIEQLFLSSNKNAILNTLEKMHPHKLKSLNQDVILLANEYELFFMDEMLEVGEYIRWEDFDEDNLIEISGQGYDLIGVRLDDYDSVIVFIENAHLLDKPVAFSVDDKVVLELALLLYTGISFVDSQSCEIEIYELEEITKQYGAVLR